MKSAMDATFATPHWLTQARQEIENSKVWKCFTAELFEVIKQQLAESYVRVFSDLSEAEKALLVERAAKATNMGSCHTDIVAHISSVLEDVLSAHVAKEMNERLLVSPKTDLFQSHVRDGMVSLLNKWPDMKSKLNVLFNQPLPMEIREVAWKLCLSNTKARMDYLSAVSMNKAKSRKDLDISLQCDSLLSREPTFHTLRKNDLAIQVLKRVLSYYHRIQRLKTTIPESDCFLLVPLLQVAVARSTPSTSADSVSTQLVEEYLSFMSSWSVTPTRTESGHLFAEVALMLDQTDKELTRVIQRLYSTEGSQLKESLLRGVKEILEPVIEVFFVGYLNMSTLLYVWDQYIIGLDNPLYDCLPAFSFAFLLLLRDHFQHCDTSSDLAQVTRSQGPTISVPQLQSIISTYFYEDLFGKLTRDKVESFPVLDPTEAYFPPWTHLLTSNLPMRTKPQDRRLAREAREAQRVADTQRKQQEAQHQKLKEEEEMRREKARLQTELEESKQLHREQKFHLEEQLAQERQHHYEIQKAAEEQIGHLQAEIRKIQEHKLLIADTSTEGSFGTPPPSSESQNIYTQAAIHNGTPATVTQHGKPQQTDFQTVHRTVEDVAADLLQRLIQTAGETIFGQHVEMRPTHIYQAQPSERQ